MFEVNCLQIKDLWKVENIKKPEQNSGFLFSTLWVWIIEFYRGFWPDQEAKGLHGNEIVQIKLKALKFLALNVNLFCFY